MQFFYLLLLSDSAVSEIKPKRGRGGEFFDIWKQAISGMKFQKISIVVYKHSVGTLYKAKHMSFTKTFSSLSKSLFSLPTSPRLVVDYILE